jgi:hypothetical protein
MIRSKHSLRAVALGLALPACFHVVSVPSTQVLQGGRFFIEGYVTTDGARHTCTGCTAELDGGKLLLRVDNSSLPPTRLPLESVRSLDALERDQAATVGAVVLVAGLVGGSLVLAANLPASKPAPAPPQPGGIRGGCSTVPLSGAAGASAALGLLGLLFLRRRPGDRGVGR